MAPNNTNPAPASHDTRSANWAASGGVMGAILASACCIGPLVLLALGVSGAWISNLTLLEPYKPFFATIALVFIGAGFWQVYFKPRSACEPGGACAKPGASVFTRIALWSATVLVGLALTINWWAPLFY